MSDVISGCTVAIMHIPQGMGYALLANLPPVTGIYMAFFPVLMYIIFGTSRHNSMGRWWLFSSHVSVSSSFLYLFSFYLARSQKNRYFCRDFTYGGKGCDNLFERLFGLDGCATSRIFSDWGCDTRVLYCWCDAGNFSRFFNIKIWRSLRAYFTQ